jgi:hypothetical protein
VNKDITGFETQSTLKVSAACNRVAVLDGHTACVSLRFAKRPPPSAEEVKQAMREYTTEAQTLGCPSAPSSALVVMDEPDRPQPRLDRETDRGYAVSVGRIREDESGIFDLKFVALSHNSKSAGAPLDEISFLTTLNSCHWRCRILNIECGDLCPQRTCINAWESWPSRIIYPELPPRQKSYPKLDFMNNEHD